MQFKKWKDTKKRYTEPLSSVDVLSYNVYYK